MSQTMPTLKFVILALFACWLAGQTPADKAEVSQETAIPTEVSRITVPVEIDPRLRSAFLMRARGGQWPTPAVSIADATAQLQAHFDAVLAILKRNQTSSLDLALERLEASFGRTFAADERALWRLTLAARRAENLKRLAVYRDCGQFPLNEGHADHAVPIFVDRHDTACAVGHLMRESGWEEQVDSIARENLLACLTDVRRGAAVDWTLQSGLTAEEAALIQPGYEGPAPDALFSELVSGGSIVHRGLRYDRFSVQAQTGFRGFFGPPDTPDPTYLYVPGGPVSIDTARIGVAAGSELYTDPCCGNTLFTQYDDWLFLAGIDYGSILTTDGLPGGIADEISTFSEVVELTYSFTVTAVEPGVKISGSSIHSQVIFHFNQLSGGAQFVVDSTIYGNYIPVIKNSELSALNITENLESAFIRDDQATFDPRESVFVLTRVSLQLPNSQGFAAFGGLTHSFQLTPEPSALSLLMLGALLLVGRSRKY